MVLLIVVVGPGVSIVVVDVKVCHSYEQAIVTEVIGLIRTLVMLTPGSVTV